MAELADAGGPLRHRRHADLDTGGASDRAWKRAFKELQGVDVDVPAVTGKGVPDPEVGRVVFEKAIGREPTEEEAEALMRRRLDHLPEEVESSPGYVVKDWRSGAAGAADRRTGSCSASPQETSRRPRTSSSPAPISTASSAFGGYGSDSPRSHGAHQEGLERARARLGAHARPRSLLLLWRHASRRRGRPRRGHPGGGRRHRRIHGSRS